ncbi:MAG: hypothetical protein IJX92_01500 [Clostridia bacterium]|nr:hypothetical protein [Clostridia bacterium]
MATFYNQASLSFGGSVTNSNTTTGEIVAELQMTKASATSDYGPGDSITYVVNIVNSGNTDYTGITLTDDLGRVELNPMLSVVPLTYVEGSVLYYLGGILQVAPTVTAGDSLVIEGINIPAGSNATVIYEARANAYAPQGASASINNTVTVGGGACELSDSATVPTRNEPNLTISKSVSPAVVTCAGEVTYTIVVQNTGNTEVVATDDLIINDAFNPILTNISVSLNGEALEAGVGYSYDEATGEFATLPGAITVPAATFTRDSVTGLITTTPGVAVLTVTGTV